MVQFAAADPTSLVAAAKLVEGRCDAVDLNLDWSSEKARSGPFGVYLQDDWALVTNNPALPLCVTAVISLSVFFLIRLIVYSLFPVTCEP